MHSHEDLLTAFSLSADLLLRSRLYAFAERKVLLKRNTLGGAVNRRSEKNVQQRRPPPAADTGRSCWGRGQQDTSATQGTKWSLGTATRLSEAASIFGLRLPLRGLKGASSPFLVDPARRNRWWFSGSLLTSKENISLNANALYPRAQAREPFLILFWCAKENFSFSSPPAQYSAVPHPTATRRGCVPPAPSFSGGCGPASRGLPASGR